MFPEYGFRYFFLKNLTINNRKPQTAFYTIYSQKIRLFVPLNKKMAFINPLRDIILTSPLEWDAWDDELRTKANSSDLWAHIDPITNGKKLLERPTKPKASDFIKYIYQSR